MDTSTRQADLDAAWELYIQAKEELLLLEDNLYRIKRRGTAAGIPKVTGAASRIRARLAEIRAVLRKHKPQKFMTPEAAERHKNRVTKKFSGQTEKKL